MPQLGAVLTLLVLAGGAGGESAARATVSVQAIEARAGSNRTDERIDPRLAERLRVTLEQLGVSKPDLKHLDKAGATLAAGSSFERSFAPYAVKVTCDSVAGEAVTVTLELFLEQRDPRDEDRTVRKPIVRSEVTLRAGQVQPFVQPEERGRMRLFVLAAKPAG